MSTAIQKVSDRLIEVDVRDLKIGMYVSELDRPWLETPFLFQGFEVRDEHEIEEMQRRCKYVYVDPERTDKDVDMVSLSSTQRLFVDRAALAAAIKNKKPEAVEPRRPPRVHRQHSVYTDISEFRRSLAQASDDHGRATMLVKEVMGNLKDGGKLDAKVAKKAVAPIVEGVTRNDSALTWLVRLRQTDDYLYTHSVSSAIWATLMARHLGMPNDAVEAVGLGAMLLDVGKTKLPVELLLKPDRLSNEEMVEVQRHVEYGVEIVREANLSPEIVAMVQTHHERHDGSGYPAGLSGLDIPIFGRIGGIVDYYDAVTSERPYASSLSSYNCLRSLNRLSGTGFQPEIVEHFIQSVGFFPPGTLVQLNDNSIAIVVAQNRRHRLRPEVMIILDPDHERCKTFKLVDLQMDGRSEYTDEVLHIEKGLEPGAFGIDSAEFFLG